MMPYNERDHINGIELQMNWFIPIAQYIQVIKSIKVFSRPLKEYIVNLYGDAQRWPMEIYSFDELNQIINN